MHVDKARKQKFNVPASEILFESSNVDGILGQVSSLTLIKGERRTERHHLDPAPGSCFDPRHHTVQDTCIFAPISIDADAPHSTCTTIAWRGSIFQRLLNASSPDGRPPVMYRPRHVGVLPWASILPDHFRPRSNRGIVRTRVMPAKGPPHRVGRGVH